MEGQFIEHRLLAHNNHAEAPFAVAKWLTKGFQSIRLDTTSGMVSAMKNHTFQLERRNKNGKAVVKAGTSNEAVKDAVSDMSPYRKNRYSIQDERKEKKKADRDLSESNRTQKRMKNDEAQSKNITSSSYRILSLKSSFGQRLTK